MDVDESQDTIIIQVIWIYNTGNFIYFNLIDSCLEHLEHLGKVYHKEIF